jgi:glutathione S-transferase
MAVLLYHSVESTCAQKVRIVLCTKRIDWQEILLNLRKGEQFAPAYLRLNPKAVVPTLVHDAQVVRESSVINEYLEDRFPEVSMRPKDPMNRARMRLLIKMVDDEVHPAIGVLSYAIFLRHQMNARMSEAELREHFARVVDPQRRQRQQATHTDGLQSAAAAPAIASLARFVREIGESLERSEWLGCEGFSLADAAALPYMLRARSIRLAGLWRQNKAVDRWLERGIAEVSRLPLVDPWGSDVFLDMVLKYADAEKSAITRLLENS